MQFVADQQLDLVLDALLKRPAGTFADSSSPVADRKALSVGCIVETGAMRRYYTQSGMLPNCF